MSDKKIKFVVTQEKFDELVSIDDWLNFSSLPNPVIYNYMLEFVANENEEPITKDEARKIFKTISKKEWFEYFAAFVKKINEAFVNPTNGGS